MTPNPRDNGSGPEDSNPMNIKMGASIGSQLLTKFPPDSVIEILCSAICLVSEQVGDPDLLTFASNWIDSYVALSVADQTCGVTVQQEVDAIIARGTKSDAFETHSRAGWVEYRSCNVCGAYIGHSCIVPNPNAPNITSVNGRLYHSSRVGKIMR